MRKLEELSNHKSSIQNFAKILNELESNRNLLKEMAENCQERQQELSWDKKVMQMIELYKRVLQQ